MRLGGDAGAAQCVSRFRDSISFAPLPAAPRSKGGRKVRRRLLKHKIAERRNGGGVPRNVALGICYIASATFRRQLSRRNSNGSSRRGVRRLGPVWEREVVVIIDNHPRDVPAKM